MRAYRCDGQDGTNIEGVFRQCPHAGDVEFTMYSCIHEHVYAVAFCPHHMCTMRSRVRDRNFFCTICFDQAQEAFQLIPRDISEEEYRKFHNMIDET